MTNRFSSRSAAGLLALATVALMWAAGCGPHARTSKQPTAPTAAAADFVGNEVCKECHAIEFQHHRASRHAVTLRAMNRQSLGPLSPPAGPIPQTKVLIEKEGDGYLASNVGFPETSVPLHLALGSGKTGMTYVSLGRNNMLAEIRMSYFPRQRRWYITPGQERAPQLALGRTFEGDFARRCLLCHVTTLPPDSLVPEKRFLGVGCEACHGPASAHVAAVRAGDTANLRMEKIGGWNATRINELCGKCHRTARDVSTPTFTSPSTQRFQPYGLMRSACFKQSRDTLSCLNCHDPHTDASADQKTYVAACLKCHSSSPPTFNAGEQGTIKGKICPVNASDQCVGCHMPHRKVFMASQATTTMADHFIRIAHKARK